MSEQTFTSDGALAASPAPAAASTEPQHTVGQYLRAAREERGLSIAEVASLLKLSQRQVEAIEADDWQRLPGQTFARGFLRNYARLLHLDGDMLLAHLEANLAPEPVNIELARTASGELPRPGYAKRRDLVAVFGAAGMVAVALGIYFLLPENFWENTVEPLFASQPAEPVADEKAAESEAATDAAEQVAAAAAADAAAPEGSGQSAVPAALPAEQAAAPVAAAAVAAAVPVPAPAAEKPAPAVASATTPAPVVAPATVAAAPAPAAQGTITPPGQGKLRFEFSKSSWVEIKDKTGQTLLSQLQPAGSQKEVAGMPPFVLVVGNASNVKVFYNGKPVALAPNEVSDVARITLQ